MTMTKEDWNFVEARCSHPYGRVKMNCDGFVLDLAVQSIGKLKYAIIPYVNGYIKGKWILEDCEERRRFLRPVTRPKLSKRMQSIEEQLARLGKRPSRQDVKITGWMLHWPSFGPLRRHLIRNNTDISLIRRDV